MILITHPPKTPQHIHAFLIVLSMCEENVNLPNKDNFLWIAFFLFFPCIYMDAYSYIFRS